MRKLYRKITKDQYTRAMLNRGYISSEDIGDIFPIEERCGYGVYSPMADIKDGEYVVEFYLGNSCD